MLIGQNSRAWLSEMGQWVGVDHDVLVVVLPPISGMVCIGLNSRWDLGTGYMYIIAGA